jgi:hypothetical protein
MPNQNPRGRVERQFTRLIATTPPAATPPAHDVDAPKADLFYPTETVRALLETSIDE